MEHIRGRGLSSLLAGGQLLGLTSSQPKAGPGLPPRGRNIQYRKMLQDNRASDFIQKKHSGVFAWAITKIITTQVLGTSHRKKSCKESADFFPTIPKPGQAAPAPVSINNATGKHTTACGAPGPKT